MKKFRRWNDIQSFHEVVKNLNYPRIHGALSNVNHKLKYGLKVKLHGTNACVRIEADGKVVAQKRSSDIVAPADNSGFRAWVESEERYFGNLANCAFDTYIYGEWCGSGIQNNVAIAFVNNIRRFSLRFQIQELLSPGFSNLVLSCNK